MSRDCFGKFRKEHKVPAYAEYFDNEKRRYYKIDFCVATETKCVYALQSPTGTSVCSRCHCVIA